MVIQIGECILGIFAIEEEGEILEQKLFPQKPREISKKIGSIEDEKVTDEHLKLVNKLIDEGYKDFEVESSKFASQLKNEYKDAFFSVKRPNPANEILRNSIQEIAKELGIENLNELYRDVNILITRSDLRKEASERDKIVIKSINTIDELDKSINTLYEHIREWYGIHFPELDRFTSDYKEYFNLISKIGNRENINKEKLLEVGIEKKTVEKIQKAAKNSVGSQFDELDIQAIQSGVDRIKELGKARDSISEYLEGIMEQVAPNIKTLVGSLLGARLISLAGGLEKLAKMPSSTIQVLGAEKALFRAMNKKDAKPPKHGVIFQFPDIRGSPREIRGKIARALAGKIAILARVDAMSGKYVGDEIKEELEGKIEQIKKENE